MVHCANTFAHIPPSLILCLPPCPLPSPTSAHSSTHCNCSARFEQRHAVSGTCLPGTLAYASLSSSSHCCTMRDRICHVVWALWRVTCRMPFWVHPCMVMHNILPHISTFGRVNTWCNVSHIHFMVISIHSI